MIKSNFQPILSYTGKGKHSTGGHEVTQQTF